MNTLQTRTSVTPGKSRVVEFLLPRRLLAFAILWMFGMACVAEEASTTVSGSPETRLDKAKAWIDGNAPRFISEGRLILDVNPRYEYADQDGMDVSNAFTVRTALGFETGSIYGFNALVEFEDVSIIGSENNYNQAFLNPAAAGRTVIADPEGTEVNQAWIGYSNWDTKLRLGREAIVYDQARFVGDVAWRQNHQTFDGVSLTNQSLDDFSFHYAYIYNVNRILGDDHPAGDFDSDSHLFHLNYTGCSYGTVSAYSYLLDFEKDNPADSSHTFGLRFNGRTEIKEPFELLYLAEYAYQVDAAENPLDYHAHYLHAKLGGEYDRFEAGAGYELLGSDGGVKGFTTPLATLHAFNGWADSFLTTPRDGLRDLYFYAGVRLPYDIPLKVIYHDFEADSGNADYGHEWDVLMTRKLGKRWSVLAKYANYDGGLPDRQVLWLQVNFRY